MGVEPPVYGEVGIDRERHQARRPAHKEVIEIGVNHLDGAVGQAGAQHARPLGEQHRPVGRESEVPGDAQPAHQFDDGDIGRRLPRAHRVVRHGLRRLAGALPVLVARLGPDVLPDIAALRPVARAATRQAGPVGLIRGPLPLPVHRPQFAVLVAERRPQHGAHAGLGGEEGDAPLLLDVADGDGHLELGHEAGCVCGDDRHGVLGLRLVVEGRLRLQLPDEVSMSNDAASSPPSE